MNLSYISYIYLAIFIIDTVLHLYASYKNDYPFRSVTKGMILLSLFGFYVECVNEPLTFLVIALLLSWIGDLFLIPHGVKWFTIGGISFMISHLFFILTYSSVTIFENISTFLIIIMPIIFIVAVIFIFKKLRKNLSKVLVVPMFFYLLINGIMNCFAIYRFISNMDLGSLITVIGAILFFISDTSLFFVRFNKDSVMKSHFLVMLTYSLAEFLIVLGFII